MANIVKKWFLEQMTSHPKRSVIISLLLTAIIASGIPFMVLDDDFMGLIPDTIQSKKVWERILDQYGSTERIFVAFGKKNTDIINADALAALWDMVDTLQTLPSVEDVLCVSTLIRIDNEDGFLETGDLQPYRDLSEEDIISIKEYLAKNNDMAIRLVGRHGDYLNVVIQPVRNVTAEEFGKEVVPVAEYMLRDWDVHFGGITYVTSVTPPLIRNDVMRLVRVGLIIMVIILIANLRSIPAVLMMLSVILLSLLAMLGFMGWITWFTGSRRFFFGIINSSMPIILLTIAVADGVHVLTKFLREARKQGHPHRALKTTMNTLMLPIFLTSITTIAAFLSIGFAPIEQFLGYGLTISFGIGWAWFLSVYYLPAVIYLKKWNLSSTSIDKNSIFDDLSVRFGDQVLQHPKKVFSLGILAILIGAYGITLLKIEVNPANFFKPGTPIRNSFDFIDEEMTGAYDLEVEVVGDMKDPVVLRKIERMQSFLEESPNITTTISIADIIKQLHRTVMDDDKAYEVIPDSRDKVNNLFTLYSMSGDPDDFSSLVDYDYTRGLVTALIRDFSTSMVWKLTDDLNGFLEPLSNDNFKTETTGLVVIMRDFIYIVIRSSFMSIALSVLVVFLIAWVFFRRFIWAVLAVIPLSAAIILNFGLMGLFGVELSHVTALLSSIIIGVGVDFAIHYIAQYKHYLRKYGNVPNLSHDVIKDVGYPIILNAASSLGFAALIFSSFVPVEYIGGLMVFAMFSTSVGTLTLLATLISLMRSRLAEKI
ncbi:MAG: RND family transporter [Fidelibacterota bacterium]